MLVSCKKWRLLTTLLLYYILYYYIYYYRRLNYSNDKHVLVKLRNLYLNLFLTLLRLVLTNELTRLQNNPNSIVQSKLDLKMPQTRNATKSTKTGSFLPRLSVMPKHICTNGRYCIECWVCSGPSKRATRINQGWQQEKNSFHSTIGLTHWLQRDRGKMNYTHWNGHKNNKDIVILPTEKGQVTVAMDKKDYIDKMNSLVHDKQTYCMNHWSVTPHERFSKD